MEIRVTLQDEIWKSKRSVSERLIGRAPWYKTVDTEKAREAAVSQGGQGRHVYLSKGARFLVAKYGAMWGLEKPSQVVRAMLVLMYQYERNLEMVNGGKPAAER